MKYKVGDKVVMQKDAAGGFIRKGEQVEVRDVDYYLKSYLVKCSDGSEFLVKRGFIEPSEREPDYRALYEQEKALREAAEDFIERSPCDPDIYPEQLEAWNHYQQLKQQ